MSYIYWAQLYTELNLYRIGSPYIKLFNRHPKKATKGQCQGHIKFISCSKHEKMLIKGFTP